MTSELGATYRFFVKKKLWQSISVRKFSKRCDCCIFQFLNFIFSIMICFRTRQASTRQARMSLEAFILRIQLYIRAFLLPGGSL